MKGSWKLLATGPNHVLLNRPRTNRVMSWGSNEHGALGHEISTVNTRFSPPKEVSFFTGLNNAYSVIRTDSDDENEEYQEYQSSSNEFVEDSELFQNISNGKLLNRLYPSVMVFSVACGKTHSLALTDRGIYAWGSSKYGQLGLGIHRRMSKRPEVISKLSQSIVISIACGHYHSIALDYKGRLWTWGWGVHGQLGLEDIEDEYVPRRVVHPEQLFEERICRIAAGYAHTMVATLTGNVWVFGCGLFGQLGNGENKKSTIPIKLDFSNAINSEGVMNDRIGAITCGYFHNLAVSQDGMRLYTWGCNPQLLRQEAQQKKKERLQNVLLEKMSSTPMKAAECQSSSPPINAPRIKTGSKRVYNADQEKREMSTEPEEMSTSPTSFHEQKSINKEKEDKENEMIHLIPSLLDTSALNGKITEVACGNQHSLILSSLGHVYSFGRNLEGQLGIGARNRDVKLFTLINALSDEFIIEISSGGDYSAALSDSGTLFCWGHNSSGQLGKPPMIGDSQGRSEVTGSRGKVMLLKTSKLNYKIAKLQQGTNYGILNNSCDIPKPVLGLNAGIYSDESIDRDKLRLDVIESIQRLQNGIQVVKQITPKKHQTQNKLTKSRLWLHSCIEAFYPHLEHKKLLKKCLISENPQAAAKLSLLSDSKNNILQSFEFTLQAIIKQIPPVALTEVSKQIFNAFDFYLHFNRSNHNEEASDKHTREKKQLTERLVACWQDQKLNFAQLESLFMEKSDPLLLQVLVLTLFCPDDERDTLNSPLLSSTDFNGQKLVDLFTPEFCLKVGDTFVKSMVEVDIDEGFVSGSSKVEDRGGLAKTQYSNAKGTLATCGRRRKMVVSRWLERQRSKDLEKENNITFTSFPNLGKSEEGSEMQECADFVSPFANIEDALNVLPKEFYSSEALDAKDTDDHFVEGSKLTDLVTDLILEGNE